MAGSVLSFPRGFLWGTASSGYQVEGDNLTSDWTEWEKQPGRIVEGQRSGRACDWWTGDRWKEDFDNAAADGHRTHRLSVEWSRIEPEPGKWNADALDHYRRIVAGLKDRGMEPMVTLHHFVNPAWLGAHGGWETPAIVPLFEAYTRKVVAALRDHVKLWCTINEPNVLMLEGWVDRDLSPGQEEARACDGGRAEPAARARGQLPCAPRDAAGRPGGAAHPFPSHDVGAAAPS